MNVNEEYIPHLIYLMYVFHTLFCQNMPMPPKVIFMKNILKNMPKPPKVKFMTNILKDHIVRTIYVFNANISHKMHHL